MPAISLGAWETFGGYRGEDVAREVMYRAFDLGITHFDLANNYGKPPGNAEIVVGRILRDMPCDELIIWSKAGYYMWPGPYGEWLSKKITGVQPRSILEAPGPGIRRYFWVSGEFRGRPQI